MKDQYLLGEHLTCFLKKPTAESSESLSRSLIPVVQRTLEDFRVVARYDELVDKNPISAFDALEKSPMPGQDDVLSAVQFESFRALLPRFNPADVLHNDAIYYRILDDSIVLPETEDEVVKQKASSVVRMLVNYWFSNNQYHKINEFTTAILSVMNLISDFQSAIARLPIDYPGRYRAIKLLWLLREETVFSIDRVGRKFSNSCYRRYTHTSGLRYEMDLFMEKAHVLIDSEKTKVSAFSDHTHAVVLLGLIDKMSSSLIDKHLSASLVLAGDVNESNPLLDGVSNLSITNKSTQHNNRIESSLKNKLQQFEGDHSDPLSGCVINEVSLLLEQVINYQASVEQGSHDPWHRLHEQGEESFNIINVLYEDIGTFIDGIMEGDLTPIEDNNKLQNDQRDLAHRMLEHITYYQKYCQRMGSLQVMAPLDALVSRLEYVLYEQSIFLNAYSNLLKSIEDFDEMVGDLSREKQAMIRPYAQSLRLYSSEYAAAISAAVEKPHRYTADPILTQNFKEKMEKVIKDVDQCLCIHRHPPWFRTAIRLMMSVTHFVASYLTVGPHRLHHQTLSSELYHTDYLPASSVFAQPSVDNLSHAIIGMDIDAHS